jgi:hypothetical protein
MSNDKLIFLLAQRDINFDERRERTFMSSHRRQHPPDFKAYGRQRKGSCRVVFKGELVEVSLRSPYFDVAVLLIPDVKPAASPTSGGLGRQTRLWFSGWTELLPYQARGTCCKHQRLTTPAI